MRKLAGAVRELFCGWNLTSAEAEDPAMTQSFQYFHKMSSGVTEMLGRTVTGVLMLGYSRERFRVLIAFDDGTHYEIHGEGRVQGRSEVDEGGWEFILANAQRDTGVLEKAGVAIRRVHGRGPVLEGVDG